jgi:hypothetical protein
MPFPSAPRPHKVHVGEGTGHHPWHSFLDALRPGHHTIDEVTQHPHSHAAQGSSWTATGFVAPGLHRGPANHRPRPGGLIDNALAHIPKAPHHAIHRPHRSAAPGPRPASSHRVTVNRHGITGPADRLTPGTRATRPSAGTPAAPPHAAKPAVDPIQQIVNDMIAGMNAPLKDQARQLNEQHLGNVNQNDRLGEFYDQQLQGIQKGADTSLASAVQRAAELKGLSAETIAKNQAYLHSLMGESHGGTQEADTAAAGQRTASDLAGYNDQMAREVVGSGQSLDTAIGGYRAAGRANQREQDQQDALRTAAGQRDLQAQQAMNSAKAPQLRQELQAQQAEQRLKQAVAEQTFGLKAASQNSLDAYRQGQLALQKGRLNLDAVKAQLAAQRLPSGEAPGRFGNIPKKYDSAIAEVYDEIYKGLNATVELPDGRIVPSPAITKPWRQTHQELVNIGLNPTAAAFIASKWFGGPAFAQNSNPYNIRVMLANRGVAPAAQRRIIIDSFGPGGWTQAQKKPKKPDLLGDAFDQIHEAMN